MSVWFEKIPENMAPKNVVAIIINGTTRFLSHPDKQTPIMQRAGIIEAVKIVVLKLCFGLWYTNNIDVNIRILLKILCRPYLSIVTASLRSFWISTFLLYIYPSRNCKTSKRSSCTKMGLPREKHSETLIWLVFML